MNKTLLTIMMVSAVGLAGYSQAAHAGTKQYFEFKASELDSDQGQQEMLLRLKAKAQKVCVGKLSEAYKNAEECASDLESQFIAAIDDLGLTTALIADRKRMASAER